MKRVRTLLSKTKHDGNNTTSTADALLSIQILNEQTAQIEQLAHQKGVPLAHPDIQNYLASLNRLKMVAHQTLTRKQKKKKIKKKRKRRERESESNDSSSDSSSYKRKRKRKKRRKRRYRKKRHRRRHSDENELKVKTVVSEVKRDMKRDMNRQSFVSHAYEKRDMMYNKYDKYGNINHQRYGGGRSYNGGGGWIKPSQDPGFVRFETVDPNKRFSLRGFKPIDRLCTTCISPFFVNSKRYVYRAKIEKFELLICDVNKNLSFLVKNFYRLFSFIQSKRNNEV